MRTPCGLRTVVTILEIFAELLGDTFGKVPCYNTVENWVKKLGLSVYQDEQPCKDKKFAMVVDESIAINGQKLLLTLAIPSEHQGRPVRHEDVTILDMSVSKGFNGDDVQSRIEEAKKSEGTAGCNLCCKTHRGHLQERRFLGHDEQEVQALYHHSCLGKRTFPTGTCRYRDA